MAGSVRTTNYILNIGLNDNPFRTDDLIEMVEIMGFSVDSFEEKAGQYDGHFEPTLVLKGTHSTIEGGSHNAVINSLVDDMCVAFEQEAIPVKSGWFLENEYLGYHVRYKGAKATFDGAYFLQ